MAEKQESQKNQQNPEKVETDPKKIKKKKSRVAAAKEKLKQGAVALSSSTEKKMEKEAKQVVSTSSDVLSVFAKTGKLDSQRLSNSVKDFSKSYAQMWLVQTIAKEIVKKEDEKKLSVDKEADAARAYVKNTFGNKEFQKSIEEKVSTGVNKALDSRIEQAINSNLDSNIKLVNHTVETFSTQATTKIAEFSKQLNLTEKIGAVEKLTNALGTNLLSSGSLNDVLNKDKAGCFGGTLSDSSTKVDLGKVESAISSKKFLKKVEGVQGSLLQASKQLQQATKEVQAAEKKIRETIKVWKEQLTKEVQAFAKRIFSSVKDVIVSGIRNMVKSWFGPKKKKDDKKATEQKTEKK